MIQKWRPPPWTCETVAVLAGGESLSMVDIARLRCEGIRTVAINNSYLLAPWADVLYAADAKWWIHHLADAMGFAGEKICSEQNAPIDELQWLEVPRRGFTRNSALNITEFAASNGAARVLLLGIDLHVDRLTHWHGLHAAPLRNPQAVSFQNAIKAWGHVAREICCEVINCNPTSALTCFPRMALSEALCARSAA